MTSCVGPPTGLLLRPSLRCGIATITAKFRASATAGVKMRIPDTNALDPQLRPRSRPILESLHKALRTSVLSDYVLMGTWSGKLAIK